jgi:hypothetical protein
MLGVTAAPRRISVGVGTTVGGTLAVTFSPPIFNTPPIVSANLYGTTAGIITVNSVTATGFTAYTFNTAGTLTNYSFSYIATL